jgi:two-component sensor histidine kinase
VATRNVTIIAIIASVLAFTAAILVGRLFGKSLLVSIHTLTEETRQVREGVYRRIEAESPYDEIERLIDTFNAMAEKVRDREAEYEESNRQLQDALRQKDVLLQEVHHRVKNNLQIVSSLLSLQGEALVCAEDRRSFDSARLRIHSMAMVHERIYRSEGVESLSLKTYVQELVELLVSDDQSPTEFSVQGEEVFLSLTHAVPCALSVFEACTNALKYGTDGNGRVRLTVAVDKEATARSNQVRVVVRDSGPGFPDSFEPGKSKSLGFTLMRGLMEQLGGHLSWYNDAGAVVELTFPLL